MTATMSTWLEHEAAAHQDRVDEAWSLVLGEDGHYGVFESPLESLGAATRRLTGLMSEAGAIHSTDRVLAIGRGRDAGRMDGAFDRAWAMEPTRGWMDRAAVMSGAARALRPGGRLVLCDVVRRREVSFSELRARADEFAVLRRVFGSTELDRVEHYFSRAADAGLEVDTVLDLSQATVPTFTHWRGNLDEHHDTVVGVLGIDVVADFVHTIDVLEDLWNDGTLGYALFAAVRTA